MAFLDTIKNALGIGTPASKPAASSGDPVWKQLGYSSQDAYNLDNGLPTSDGRVDTALVNNSKGLQGDGSGPIAYPSTKTLGNVAPPANPAPANPNATVAPAKVLPDRTNDINQNKAALEGTNSLLTNGISSIKNALSSLLGKYDTESGANEANYTDQSNSNKQGYLKGQQSALLNAAQGRQGLFGVLASLGALNGSGVELANRAVQQGANADISGANDVFATNQSGLDTNIGQFRTADKSRREDAAGAATDAEKALRSDVAQKQQGIYSNLSNDYADMENAGEAKRYSDLLAALFPQIAQNAVPSAGPTYQAAGYTPASLDSYLSGGTTVNATPAAGLSGLPGLLAYVAPSKKREQA